jgi:hypothetical protein
VEPVIGHAFARPGATKAQLPDYSAATLLDRSA